jgi:transcriptional regulator of arginine metabolism
MPTRKQRQEIILDLVARNQIYSQEQLQELLLVDGIEATQATISRDLRDLGIVKTPKGYVIIDLDRISQVDVQELRRSLKADVREIARAASMLVLKTNFGVAKALAIKLEKSKLPQIVGTIAGDDTIFIATQSTGQAGELRRLLTNMVK